MSQRYNKKLIEVALPLEAINSASAHEKQPGIGAHPRGLHLWWARRPLAAARAVIFAQMVDDPSAHPDLFPTEKAQEKERKRLFKLIEELVKWENTNKEALLQQAKDEIWQSWRRTCAENVDHPQASDLFDRHKLPAFHDPFAGGGALPLEAQRLGLEAHASDLNPVAVLINKAMIEIPPKYAGCQPLNPDWQRTSREEKMLRQWKGAQGLAEDVRYYGQWMRSQAERRIGHLYPKVEVTKEIVNQRPDLRQYLGRTLDVIAWLWVRTVKSPNPAFANVEVPLASTFMLSTKSGREAYVEPLIENGSYRFDVMVGKPKNAEAAKNGTKVARGANFRCLMSGVPITGDYIKSEGRQGRMGTRLMAIVANGDRGRCYLPPSRAMEELARGVKPDWKPETPLPDDPRNFWTLNYGLTTFGDLFTARQLVALTTFSDLVGEVRNRVKVDAQELAKGHGTSGLDAALSNPDGYADAVALYVSFAISRLADYNSSIATWKPSGEQVMQTYKRQALPMTWDFPESNVLGDSAICWRNAIKYTSDNLEAVGALSNRSNGFAVQAEASTQSLSLGKIISTDPPYYDNIGYADLSDFFYVWLRRSLRQQFQELFATLVVPKAEELVATPYRHGSTDKAEAFFLGGMRSAMGRIAAQGHPAFPVTIYYAFKQSETEDESGTSSTGWETFLEAVIQAGFAINGTWPMRTELSNRIIGSGTNALASSIVLVCRPHPANAPTATRRDFLNALKAELPLALSYLQRGNIAPVDFAQASIGPGMAIYSRYSRVIDADGKPLTVRHALTLINEVLDEVLTEQEGDFDSDTRWAVAWFEQFGFSEGEFGIAETLSKAKNTSVGGIVDAGIVVSRAGRVRLLKPEELPADWSPESDKRLTVWETIHHLIRTLAQGESAAATLAGHLGSKAEVARELAYRLYSICERKKRSQEALAYNALVQSWPEIIRLARQTPIAAQTGLFEEN